MTRGRIIPHRILILTAATGFDGDLSNRNMVDYATVQSDECPDRTTRPERPFQAGLRRRGSSGSRVQLSGTAQPTAAFRLKAQQLYRRFGKRSSLPVQPPDKDSIA